MRKASFIGCFLIFISVALHAQEKVERFEVGGLFTYLRLSGVRGNRFGLGSRFVLNFTENLALDSEWSITPADKTLPITDYAGGRTNQFFVGIKGGVRRKQFGAFFKTRPGLITSGRVVKTIVANSSIATLGRRTDPLLDFGGVFEFYPSKRWVLRYDLSDTAIFYGDSLKIIGLPPPFPSALISPGNSTNNFHFTAGVNFRF